ncbi:hypothetical protein OCOL_001238 [Ordospora colligata]|uniref:WD40 domain-containing protein n=1 Tax=Ordospora colligata OC4 TaxID=1354746 RepID=A0A0B2UCY0_9MICR|nr:uncharacterized protein M896_121340 [Ordospora colligata OC4]KHN68911.1 hypothetical protein M896_121340 [Ordospora colligata OC4]TBU14134.1 hypothetical protein CWI41_121340 [Ordospora colligata]
MDIHKDTIHSIEADFSQRRIVTASSDGLIRVFSNGQIDASDSLALDSELNASLGPATKAIFLGNGELIVSAYFCGMVIVWKSEGGRFVKKLEKQLFEGSVNDLDASCVDGTFVLYCACSDGNVRIMKIGNTLGSADVEEVLCHRFGVSSISATENGFVSGGMDYSVAIWENGKEVARMRDHKAFVRDVAVCPTNAFKIFCMASCSEDGNVIIYTNKQGGYATQTINLNEPCYSLSWGSSGFSLSVGYGDSKFKCFVPDASGAFKEVGLRRVEE